MLSSDWKWPSGLVPGCLSSVPEAGVFTVLTHLWAAETSVSRWRGGIPIPGWKGLELWLFQKKVQAHRYGGRVFIQVYNCSKTSQMLREKLLESIGKLGHRCIVVFQGQILLKYSRYTWIKDQKESKKNLIHSL